MPTIIGKDRFLTLPWKNGGGVTTELYRRPSPESASEFLFRLSIASVKTSGPFSVFPGVERSLILLRGNGFKLSSPLWGHQLDRALVPLSFPGEIPIQCDLLEGECEDFNVMIKRDWGSAKTSVLSMPTKVKADKETFIFEVSKERLIRLISGEEFSTETGPSIVVTIVH